MYDVGCTAMGDACGTEKSICKDEVKCARNIKN